MQAVPCVWACSKNLLACHLIIPASHTHLGHASSVLRSAYAPSIQAAVLRHSSLSIHCLLVCPLLHMLLFLSAFFALFFSLKKNVPSITSQTSKHSLASCSTSGLVVPFLANTTTPGEPQQSPSCKSCGHLYCPENSYQLAMVQQSGNACSEANGLNSAVTGGEC